MAIKGTFLADFTAFNTAVQKAEVSLKGMETEAHKVGTALNRMVDQFSGRKLIQEAQLMSQTFELLASRGIGLTTKELQRMGAVASEAIAKLKAGGESIPPGLQKIADAAAAAAKQTQQMSAHANDAGVSFKTLFGSFTAAGLATRAITSITSGVTDMVSSAISGAGAMVDLSNKTGLSLKTIQQFQGVAIQSGVSVDALTTSVFKLGTNLAEGGDKAKKAVSALGLSFEELSNSKPDEAFNAVIRALEAMPPSFDRNLAMQQLFGKGAQEVAKLVADGYTDMAAEVKTASDEQIRALDAAGDAWARFKRNAEVEMQAFLGSLVLAGEQAQKTPFWRMFLGGGLALASGAGGIGSFRDALLQIRHEAEQINKVMRESTESMSFEEWSTLGSEGSAGKSVESFRKELEALQKAIDALTPAQKAAIIEANKYSKSADEIAVKLDLSKDVVDGFIKSIKGKTSALKDGNKEMVAHAKTADELLRVMEKLPRTSEAYATALDRVSEMSAKVGRESLAAGKAIDQMFRNAINSGAMSQFSKWGDKQKAILHDTTEATVAQLKAEREYREYLTNWMTGEGNQYINHLEDTTDTIKTQREEIKKITEEVAKFLDKTSLISELLGTFGGMVGGSTGQIATQIGGVVNAVGDARKAFGALSAAQAAGIGTTGATIAALAAGGVAMYAVWKTVIAITEKFEYHAGQFHEVFLRATGQLRDFNLAARAAGVDLVKLFSIKDKHDFEVALANAQRQIEKTNQAMQEYGLTWRDFNSVAQEFVTQIGRDLVEQFDHFISMGGDAERILGGMSKAMSQLVVDAVKTGSKIPAALRPMLEQLIRTKQLSEDAAAALLGISRDAVPAFADIEAAANRYGIEIDALGNAIQQIRINEMAAQIVRDFKLITEAGGDVNTVIAGMVDEVQELVSKALTLGIALPENMRPIIQAMIDAGLLTDAFGNKLTDLTGINFKASLTDKIEELIDAIKELINETDRFGDRAVHQFGRARNAAEATGRAIPRGFAPPGETPDDNRAVPRPGTEPPPETEAATQGLTNMEAEFNAMRATAAQVGDVLPGALQPFIQTASVSVDSTAALGDALLSIGKIDLASPLIAQLDWLNRKVDVTLDRIRLNMNELLGDLKDIDRTWLTKIPPPGSVSVPDEERVRAFQQSQDILRQTSFNEPPAPVVTNYYATVERAYGTVDEQFVNSLLDTASGGRTYTRFRQVLG